MGKAQRSTRQSHAEGLATTIRVCITAPSLRTVGGQAVQASRLLAHFGTLRSLRPSFIPHDPVPQGFVGRFNGVKYVKTLTRTLLYIGDLVRGLYLCDIVHVFSAAYFSFVFAPMWAILIGRLYGRRVVLNYRSGEAADHLERWRWFAVPIMRLAHDIIAPTPYLVGVFAAHGLRARVIPNFLELDQLTYRERTPIRPVFLSNRLFEPHYNVPDLLRAFARIQSRVPEASLLLVGYGSDERLILELVRELRLRNIEYLGKLPPAESRKVYDRVDIYLCATAIDCFPNSVIEAFASGVAVVSTNAGGIPHLITHERTGLLVPIGDVEGLATQALRLLEEPELCRTITRNAYQEVRSKYIWSVVARQWEDLFCGLMRRALPAGAASPASDQQHAVA